MSPSPSFSLATKILCFRSHRSILKSSALYYLHSVRVMQHLNRVTEGITAVILELGNIFFQTRKQRDSKKIFASTRFQNMIKIRVFNPLFNQESKCFIVALFKTDALFKFNGCGIKKEIWCLQNFHILAQFRGNL